MPPVWLLYDSRPSPLATKANAIEDCFIFACYWKNASLRHADKSLGRA
jgi:hypothetical protein